MAESEQTWFVTVIRSDGLYFIRPAKWRPIVTIQVDDHHFRETTLGCDGQNPNCKELLSFQEADVNSKVEIKIWHQPISKKKKKRNLVAHATHSFAELLKRQDPKTRVQVKLTCQSPAKRAGAASRGKPQSGAVLHLRVRPPSSVVPSEPEDTIPEVTYSDNESCVSSERPSTPTDDLFSPNVLIQDENIKPYSINSDDDEAPPYDEPEAVKKPLFDSRPTPPRTNPVAWLVASLLPQYTEKLVVPPELNRLERILAGFTAYAELKTAQRESNFEDVFRRLQMEWTYVGGLLVALAAVDTAVFSISPDSIFTIDSYARAAIATSSVASGLGITTDAWFVLRYTYADLQTFISRAKDVYGTYFFFSLSARVPAICMLMSAISLMGFLALVAFAAWPNGTLVVCFFIGLIMTLQFLVYGVHWFGRRIAQGGRVLVRRMSMTN